MATPKRSASKVAATLPQLKALSSRLRGRICDAVYQMGTATIHEIAVWLDVPASTLYTHMDLLVEVGLLEEVEATRTGKNLARTFEAPAARLRVCHESEDPETREAIADVVSAQVRFAEKEFRAALAAGESGAGTGASPVRSLSMVGWLGAREVRELGRLLGEIEALFAGSGPGGKRRCVGFTAVSRPLGPAGGS